MRSSRFVAVQCGVLLACGVGATQTLHADFGELIRRVPEDANAIVLIDAERLLASPIAQREGWKKQYTSHYADRPLAVPPQSTKVLRAAHVDLQAQESVWEIAMLEASRVPSLDDIAKREKGFIDKVANKQVAWSPRGAYVVKLGDSALGLTFPPNRQFLSRWLKAPSSKISDYLLKASQSMATTDAQILLAIDLEDAIEPTRAQAWAKEFAANQPGGGAADAVGQALESLRGIKFEVVFNTKAWGRLLLEFERDPAAVVPVARPLVIQTLERHGMSLDDLGSWKESSDGNSISLHGELSSGSLLRLGSLFELPYIDLEGDDQVSDDDRAKIYATQNHFKSVNKLLNELVSQKRDAKSLAQLGTWFTQFARRIDRLPLVNVDSDMQAYSAGVAEDLRQISASIKGGGIRSGVRTASTYDSSSYGGGNYDGYYGNRPVDNERRAIRAQERGQTAMTATQIADQIRADTSRIRRQMSERYKTEF